MFSSFNDKRAPNILAKAILHSKSSTAQWNQCTNNFAQMVLELKHSAEPFCKEEKNHFWVQGVMGTNFYLHFLGL